MTKTAALGLLLAALAGGAASADPAAAWKDIPLDGFGGAKLTLGGQARARLEDTRANDFGLAKPYDNRPWLGRLFLSADLNFGGVLRFYGETVSGFAPNWNGPAPGTQSDALDLLQGFAEVSLPLDRGRLQATVGRQEMSFGASRLVSVRDSPNVRRAFDGVRAAWTPTPEWRIDAFAVRPVIPQNGVGNDLGDPGQRFWGVYGTLPVVPALKADVYYLGLDRDAAKFTQGTARQQAHTFGARLFGKAGGFDGDLEAALQVGRFGADSLRAWMLAGDFGYTFSGLPFAPRLGVKGDAASGDGDPRDHRLGTFYPLFPRLPTFSEANLIAPENLIDVQPNVSFTPLPTLRASVGWNPFWKASTADAYYYGLTLTPVAGTSGGRGRYLGQQIVTAVQWRPTPQIEAGATYVPFRPGPRLKAAGAREGSFAAAWLTLSF